MAASEPRILNVTVSSIEEVKKRTVAAFSGIPQGSWHSFSSLELMWKVLSPKRWEILEAMCGQEPMSVRGLARKMGRDVKAVHGDVQALIKSRIVHKTESGSIEFPYDAIEVKFRMAKKAA
jgi:predicted transcriptional regulator